MKTMDVIAAILLVVGGLNWGLVGAMDFDLVTSLFGSGSFLASTVYLLVGASALWQAMGWKSIQRRWASAPAAA